MRAITGVMEDYLKVIYKLQQALGSATTSAVAGRMGVSAASATSMIKRLARQRLVVHTPYRGLVLTPQGRASPSTPFVGTACWNCICAATSG